MVNQWRCERCNTMHNPVGILSDRPETCRECGHDDLEVLGTDVENQDTLWWRYLSVDSFTLLAMGMAVFNILAMVLGGFINNGFLFRTAGVSLPVLIIVAYLASNRTARGWYTGLVLSLAIAAYGAFVAVSGYLVFSGQEMGFISTAGDTMRAKFFSDTSDPLFIIYGAFYAILGLLGTIFLLGSRDEISEFHGGSGDARDEAFREDNNA